MGFSASSLTILHSFYSFYLCIISVFYSHIGTQKTRTSVSKSVFCGPEKTCFIEITCRNPRVYIIHTHTDIGTRKCGYTHEHLPILLSKSCWNFLRFNSRFASVSKRFASATRSQKADTAPLNQQATCAFALPADWKSAGRAKVAKRIIMSTKPTQPLSQDTAVSVIESPPREFCIGWLFLPSVSETSSIV